MGNRIHNGARTARGILGLEDSRTYKDRFCAKLHHQRRVRRGCHTAGRKVRHRQLSGLRDFDHQIIRCPKLSGLGHQLFTRQQLQAAHTAAKGAQMTHGLYNIAGTGFTLGSDHRGALADAAQRLTEIAAAADKGYTEVLLVNMESIVGRGENFALIYEINAQSFEDLCFNKMSDSTLGHHRDCDRFLNVLDYPRIGHPRYASGGSDICRNAFQRHDSLRAGVSCNLCLLSVGDIHYHATFEHFRQANLGSPSRLLAFGPQCFTHDDKVAQRCTLVNSRRGNRRLQRRRGICYYGAVEQQTISERLAAVRESVDDACRRAGRSAEGVTIMAVTKTQDAAAVHQAYQAGIRCFGENRVQEALQKYQGELCRLAGLDLQMIGHLQRNKARDAVSLFSTVQSIDKPQTAEALQQWCHKSNRTMDVLIEYNTSGEDSKHGITTSHDLLTCVEKVLQMDRLQLRGAMTIGPFTEDQQQIRAAFRLLAQRFEEVRQRLAPPAFDVLSMGMSNDYQIAVEEGSTMLRLGTVLFGSRS